MNAKSSQRRKPSPVRLPFWALAIIALALLVGVTASTIWLFRTIRNTTADLEFSSPDFGNSSVASDSSNPAIISNPEPGDPNTAPAQLLSADALEPWSGSERVSILLLGIDQRCEEDGPTHTDSMMLVSIDPVGLSATVLSLPRDLWVTIPGFGVDRINQANYYGEAYDYPGGGPALAVETVSSFLGVPIDYYVAVNFDAFTEFVDLIGGITIDVPEDIDDPKYPDRCYGYDPFQIDAGEQSLDGASALKYARTRATFGGDVDRAERQQAVILAVRDQVIRLNMLPQMLRQAPSIWQTVQDNVRTNLTLDQMVQMALLAQDIPADSITTAVIDYEFVYNETTPDGREVLVPVRDDIRDLRDQLFLPPALPTPVLENLPALMRQEGARVAVYNGTAVFGLAGDTQDYLQSYDVDIVEIGNADAATYPTTRIFDYGDHPRTTSYLVQLMGVPPLNVRSSSDPEGDFDILIIIGNDWRIPES